MTHSPWKLLIDKTDIGKAELQQEHERAPLAAGEIDVRLTRFGLTSNNVTYALLGSSFESIGKGEGYWSFFPSGSDGHGLLPVWGFGEIVASTVDALKPGEILYGYFPLASDLRLSPGSIRAESFTDMAAHRQALPGAYNRYQRIAQIPTFSPAVADYWPVFQPLLVTGYMIADQFEDDGDYGVDRIFVASASSKTALMFAHCLRARKKRPALIGFTSSANADFVRQSGLYDQTVSYDALESLDREIPSALVDMAGSGDLIERLYRQQGKAMRFGLLVGRSHWTETLSGDVLKRHGIKLFFAPGRMKKRTADWGADRLNENLGKAWQDFVTAAARLTEIVSHRGAVAARDLYHTAVKGRLDPRKSDLVVLD